MSQRMTGFRRTPRIGLLSLAGVTGLLIASASASPVDGVSPLICDGQWHTVRAVDVTKQYGDFNSLNAMAALSSSDVWAVGQFRQFALNDYDQTLAEHWNGTKWKVIPTPTPAKPISILWGAAAISPQDVWAVGYERDVGSGYYTLIEHWDGKKWTIVQDASGQGWLTSVAAVSSTDVWAVGSTDYIGHGLIEHWDGKSWTRKTLQASSFLRAVTAIGQDDVWAVGQTPRNGDGDHTYALHFDGTSWTHVRTPSPLRLHTVDQNWLTSVTALASDDVWAAGVTRDPDYGILDRTLTEHWDGRHWRVVHSPHLGHDVGNDFWAAAALSSTDVWSLGSVGNDPNFRPLGEYWNGGSWTRTRVPSSGTLLGLAAISSTPELWSAGNRVKQNLYTGTLAEHLCPASGRFAR
ncbi:MAG TPA: hypothetical protein VGI20_14880 [Rhizomicrobium sp.]